MKDVTKSFCIALVLMVLIIVSWIYGNKYGFKSYCNSCDIHYSEDTYVYCPRCGNEMYVTIGNSTECYKRILLFGAFPESYICKLVPVEEQ